MFVSDDGNDEDARKEPQFTLLVRQSREFVSSYFCSCKVYDARFSRLEQKELFFISLTSLIILDQQEKYRPLIFLKGKVPRVCVCVYIYIHMHQVACIYTWKQNELHMICKPVGIYPFFCSV